MVIRDLKISSKNHKRDPQIYTNVQFIEKSFLEIGDLSDIAFKCDLQELKNKKSFQVKFDPAKNDVLNLSNLKEYEEYYEINKK